MTKTTKSNVINRRIICSVLNATSALTRCDWIGLDFTLVFINFAAPRRHVRTALAAAKQRGQYVWRCNEWFGHRHSDVTSPGSHNHHLVSMLREGLRCRWRLSRTSNTSKTEASSFDANSKWSLNVWLMENQSVLRLSVCGVAFDGPQSNRSPGDRATVALVSQSDGVPEIVCGLMNESTVPGGIPATRMVPSRYPPELGKGGTYHGALIYRTD